MASSEKRCLYEVLELGLDCSADEIRSAYRRLALQRHPDKLVRSGVPEAEATAAFQELVNAYEVLSDPRERAWYDSHRNQILFSSTSAASGSSGFVPDLFSFFSNSVYNGYSDSGRGFYKVYGDLFDRIYANELNFAKKLGLALPREAPVMGCLESPYVQARFVFSLNYFASLFLAVENSFQMRVTAFYNYWLGFITVLDFFWVDEYDAMAGPNRRSRRKMEEENKKLRKKAKREYNETVRGLAEFVKKRDKRVIDMKLKRSAEMERKREEERQKKKELEREKAEKARNYEEPEWAKVEAIEDDEVEDVVLEKRNEFYCVVCSKKFKSDKQWRNHEQSKKHKEKVAELREAFSEEDKEYEAATEGNRSEADDEDDVGYLSADEEVNELGEQFEGNVGIQENISSDDGQNESSMANKFSVIDDDDDDNKNSNNEESELDDNEMSILEAMLSEHKSRKKLGNWPKAPANKGEDSNELEFMEYNDTKGSRRNRGGRRRKGKGQEEEKEQVETMKTNVAEKSGVPEEHDEEVYDAGEPSSHSLPESGTKRADNKTERRNKRLQNAAKKKDSTKKENVSKQKAASKGRKERVATNGSDNTCEKCGEQFETRNKLHKHLGETGHASLRYQ
ncbi:DNAJ heat shock N-terminal domain-containing protein [Striga asiatica]|uniref:DNAJ heat shock N-terminal domain-containing protein n=1 Tax=Striga asiatica TaxID=4170 RepID=A0A5A7QMD6_STRAF|nr:DNAJ heat shock N-terminal domain-containing protein [Striga asiatica]